jgi:hypothetical protein
MGARFFFFLVLCVSMPHPAHASESKPAESGIAAVMQSPAVQQRFRHCGQGSDMPVRVRLTFLIGANGEVHLLKVEPAVKKSIETCLGNVADILILEPPGKPYKLVMTMDFSLPVEPARKPAYEPDPGGKVTWRVGTRFSVAGFLFLTPGVVIGLAGMIAAYGAHASERSLKTAFITSQLAFGLVFHGSILSLIGTSTMAMAMRKQGLHSSPAGAVLGGILAGIGAPLTMTFGALIYSNGTQVDQDYEVQFNRKYLAGWTVGSVLCLLAFAAHIGQFAYQRRKMKKYGATAVQRFPLVAYAPDPETGGHMIGLIWSL